MKISSVLLSALWIAACAFPSVAADVTWTGGANGLGYEWDNSSNWDTGSCPGSADTARFVNIPRFVSLHDQGKTQNIAIANADAEVAGIRFENDAGIKVYGGKNLTASFLEAADLESPATNTISAYLVLGVPNMPVFVGENHTLSVESIKITSLGDNSYGLTKTGPGTLNIYNTYGNEYIGTTYVAEGRLNLKAYNAIRADLVVGDGVHDASVVVQDGSHIQTINPVVPITILTNGYLRMPAQDTPGTIYGEVQRIHGGTLDYNGNGIYQYNQSTTEGGPVFILEGGILTNISYTLTHSVDIRPSDRMSAIYGTLNFGTAYTLEVPDGDAPVDFLVSGDLAGLNRGIHKDGAGTMLVRCEDAISTWGGVAGRVFNVYGGCFFIESSDTGIGMGTNNVVVAAGASYGGVGRHVGAPVVNRGLWGNVTLNGTAEARAAFVPGRIDTGTGAIVPGTFYLGSSEQTNNVISSGYGELRCRIDGSGAASCLAVNGRLQLSATDRLAIVGPEKIPAGTYTLATFTNGFDNRFAEVSVNGVDIDAAPGAVTYFDAQGERIAASSFGGAGSIVYNVPEMAMLLMIQ